MDGLHQDNAWKAHVNNRLAFGMVSKMILRAFACLSGPRLDHILLYLFFNLWKFSQIIMARKPRPKTNSYSICRQWIRLAFVSSIRRKRDGYTTRYNCSASFRSWRMFLEGCRHRSCRAVGLGCRVVTSVTMSGLSHRQLCNNVRAVVSSVLPSRHGLSLYYLVWAVVSLVLSSC